MSKSKAVSLSLILLTSLFLFNCSDSTEPTIDEPTELIPLKIGNNWNYIITHYDSNGTVINSNEQLEEISKDTVISGTNWFVYKGTDAPYFYALSNKSNGLWVYFGNVDSSILFYKYPVSIGDVSHIFEVTSVDATVLVPAGEFKCIKFLVPFSDINPSSSEIFYTPGVGRVKSLQYGLKADGSSYLEYKIELKSYILY